jgi:hypothetical protein
MITMPGSTLLTIACSLAFVPGPPLLGTGIALLGRGVGGAALLLGCGAADVLDAGWYRATTEPAPKAPAASATPR